VFEVPHNSSYPLFDLTCHQVWDGSKHALRPGLTNSMNFIEIRRIRSSPNFKVGDFTVHGFKIFENIKNIKKLE
jgi:hypothetical protein